MIVSPGSLTKIAGVIASAVLVAAFTLAAPAVTASKAYAYDSGGYSNDDDEDGYEDGQDAPDVAFFYDELENQGTWEDDSRYGRVWRPRNVDADWRPYSRGTWANTEENGWYWVSDEPFGWATYHYGRWFLDSRRGWIWVPGTRWAPAWVAWRSNDDDIGWAPLPPDAYWEHGSGLRVSASLYEGPSYGAYWSFVALRYITAPRIYTYCAPPARVVTIINVTRPQTNYVFVNRRIVNRGVSVTQIERVTRTRITTVRINNSDNVTYRTVQRNTNVINVYRPKLTRVVVKDRPNVNRAQVVDVDRRPPRPNRNVQPNVQDNRPQTPAYTGPVGIPHGTDAMPGNNNNANRSLRANAPDLPNTGPRGQFKSDKERDRDAAVQARRLQREQNRQENRANAQRNNGPNNGPANKGPGQNANNRTGPAGFPVSGGPNAKQGGKDDAQAEARRRQQAQQNKKNQNPNGPQ